MILNLRKYLIIYIKLINNRILSVRYLILILCLAFTSSLSIAQSIKIDANNQNLSEIFVELNRKNSVQFSYDEILVSSHNISLNKEFYTIEDAVYELIKLTDLEYRLINGVYVLKKKKQVQTKHFFYGKVIDGKSNEVIPFSNIFVNKSSFTTDLNGGFSILEYDSIIKIRIFSLGYNPLDTIIKSYKQNIIKLNPSILDISEVVIFEKNKSPDYIKQVGLVRLNYRTSSLLNGKGESNFFPLMRTQSGILASGDQANDFTIWGSYKGQTQVVYDGITIFNLSGYNDFISTINPSIINCIDLYKGGYNVDIGDRVGGLINIEGKCGNIQKPVINMNLNNLLSEFSLSVPIGKKNSLLGSFRRTIYDLINVSFLNKNNYIKNVDGYSSSHRFLDCNVKLSGIIGEADNYSLSVINSYDNFNYNFSDNLLNTATDIFHENTKKNFGASFKYSKKILKYGIVNAIASYSVFNNHLTNIVQVDSTLDLIDEFKVFSDNIIIEKKINIEYTSPKKRNRRYVLGLGIIKNETNYDIDFVNYRFNNMNKDKISRLNTYFKNQIIIFDKFNIEPGLKVDLSLTKDFFIQPRLTANYDIDKNSKISVAVGRYNQFVSENSLLDANNNLIYFWNVSDNVSFKSLSSNQAIISYNLTDYKKISFNIDFFHKKTSNINRLKINSVMPKFNLYYGSSRAYGSEINIQKRIRNNQLIINYLLSKTEERFEYFENSEYIKSPQDQRHEVKISYLFTIKKIVLRLNEVYGSGLYASYKNGDYIRYNRLDVELSYKARYQNINLEFGFLIVNILNANNYRYYGLNSMNNDLLKNYRNLPLTPIVFLSFNY